MSLAEPRAPCPSTAPLSEAEFRLLRDFLYDQSGLHFADNKRFLLEMRVQKRLASIGMGSVADYYALLRSPARGPKELLELLDIATTHETSFFRNQPQLDAFRRVVLPQLLERRKASGCRSLKIWSAACSSGEEPYTLAMLILEHIGEEARQWRVRILGSDIAQSVLQKAQSGVYSHYSFRNTPPYYLQKYFEPAGNREYRLKDDPRQMVTFQLLNFADDARMRSMGGYQLIFCRNALIYFDREAKRRVVAHFSSALEPGGYLFVGHSESLHGISDALKLIHLPGALAYLKPEPEADRRTSPWHPTA